jgi:hypothetical protein
MPRESEGIRDTSPNDGQYHRKYTAPHHFGAGPSDSNESCLVGSKVVRGKDEKAG